MGQGSQLDDRQLDAILEQLDRIATELHALNERLDTADGTQRVAFELRSLNENLQTLAYAALGQPPSPQVRRGRNA